MARIVGILLCVLLLNSWKCASQLHVREIADSQGKTKLFQVLPQNFYSQHLGFFCKKEIQVQKALAIPLYFRLGSKDYVDYLEKKAKPPMKANGGY